MPHGEHVRAPLINRSEAVSDGARLDAFGPIAAHREPLCARNAVNRFVTRPLIAHHLGMLRDASLIMASRRGNWADAVATSHGKANVFIGLEYRPTSMQRDTIVAPWPVAQ